METKNLRICKRCRCRNTKEMICQSCKTELLSNYEASSDWQIAYEIERIQLATSRYLLNENDYDTI